MTEVQIPEEQRFVLGADWDIYVTFNDKLSVRNVLCNYDGVNLELMTHSSEHQQARNLLTALLSLLTQEMDLDIMEVTSITCRREDLKQGFEPDVCYWFAHGVKTKDRVHLDLKSDPPPDFVLEVATTPCYLDRLAIAGRLAIPEIWHWDGRRLRVLVLDSNAGYKESQRSQALPFLPVSEFGRFLRPNLTQNKMKWVNDFRAWVQEQKKRDWPSTNA